MIVRKINKIAILDIDDTLHTPKTNRVDLLSPTAIEIMQQCDYAIICTRRMFANIMPYSFLQKRIKSYRKNFNTANENLGPPRNIRSRNLLTSQILENIIKATNWTKPIYVSTPDDFHHYLGYGYEAFIKPCEQAMIKCLYNSDGKLILDDSLAVNDAKIEATMTAVWLQFNTAFRAINEYQFRPALYFPQDKNHQLQQIFAHVSNEFPVDTVCRMYDDELALCQSAAKLQPENMEFHVTHFNIQNATSKAVMTDVIDTGEANLGQAKSESEVRALSQKEAFCCYGCCAGCMVSMCCFSCNCCLALTIAGGIVMGHFGPDEKDNTATQKPATLTMARDEKDDLKHTPNPAALFSAAGIDYKIAAQPTTLHHRKVIPWQPASNP